MYKPWTGHCQRCGMKTSESTLSMFNTDELCVLCQRREEAHPDYQKACDAEYAACLGGNYNFPGIGLPDDLKPQGA